MKTRNELATQLIEDCIKALTVKLRGVGDPDAADALRLSVLQAKQDLADLPSMNPQQLEECFKNYLGIQSSLLVEHKRRAAGSSKPFKP